MRITHLLLGIAAFWPGLAMAAECVTPGQFLTNITVASPAYDSRVVTDQEGEAAQPLVKLWNRLPPPSQIVADHVTIYRGVDRQTGQEHRVWVFVLFRDGCVVDKGGVPSALIRELVEGTAS